MFTDSSTTDRLMNQADDGDRRAFEQLFSEASEDLRRYIGARLETSIRRRVDVSDILQETHLLAFENFADYCARRPMPFRIWLLKTAQEQVIAARRKHLLAECRTIRKEVALPEHSSLLLAAPLLAAAGRPDSGVEREETRARVLEAVAALEEIDREMLLMRQVEERPYEEISQLLNIDNAAARKRYGRALLRLRSELARRGLVNDV